MNSMSASTTLTESQSPERYYPLSVFPKLGVLVCTCVSVNLSDIHVPWTNSRLWSRKVVFHLVWGHFLRQKTLQVKCMQYACCACKFQTCLLHESSLGLLQKFPVHAYLQFRCLPAFWIFKQTDSQQEAPVELFSS